MEESCVIAHMFTIAVVPSRTWCPATWTSLIERRAHDSRGPGGCLKVQQLRQVSLGKRFGWASNAINFFLKADLHLRMKDNSCKNPFCQDDSGVGTTENHILHK
ncbi:hypothetical protein GOP47_0030923 [Adiantum capillus-veneris]|nr:hypothetical protein GOP47_0030923 [Adiantum capillus-veneris]